ncbi:MmgE/PrpD family protein [Ancylobacter sp. MQZ15Z-1]|uniref:MmgE/PrpD family protein n=1 Tax=Ancylobacter mangrovi TaxID=2972472 RepID=A0A9X2PEE5_9HYPH|nr:MmgE/PrpD family protein [Ancylobacter mangrovi]MCS0497186.1 MmgE/PrpD family protein [Ancylobacter mangrovi]
MSSPTQILADFASRLSFEDIPDAIVRKANDAIVDSVAATVFGSTLPWSRIVIDYAVKYGGGGTGRILGTPARVATPFAALANGTLAHGFEMDNLRQPSAGVHAGSTLLPPMFAVGDEVDAGGRDLLVAFVAGCEVMCRIGVAARNTAEKLGFHSPGLTGTFGAAVTAGRLLRLDPRQMANALGIAGSLCSGLLAFSKAGNGGTVKRLHTGRASEGGVLAACLASAGFDGPDVVLEGKLGFFEAFTREPKLDELTAGLGSNWETSRICMKAYPCHVTANTPIQALRDLQAAHGFAAQDIAEIHIATSEKVLSHHDIRHPNDIATAQYSLPFCMATAAWRDPSEPSSFLDNPHEDAGIIDLAQRVVLTLNEESKAPGAAWATKLRVRLRDGREFAIERRDFRGAPSNPMSAEELDAKFLHLVDGVIADPRRLLEQLNDLRALPRISQLAI